MCTSIIYINKSSKWPVIIGSNRDEKLNRKSKFPGRHWLDFYPNIIAGKDEEKKGSWIGVNDFNIIALIHNRRKNKKINNNISRGRIILEVLNNSNIDDSLDYLSKLNRFRYDNFNLLVASCDKIYWIKHDLDENDLLIKKLEEGLSILTENELNNKFDDKINYFYQLFSTINIPDPSKNIWEDWKKNLTKHNFPNLKKNKQICCIFTYCNSKY